MKFINNVDLKQSVDELLFFLLKSDLGSVTRGRR